MDWQWVANGLFTVVGLLLGVILNATRESIKELKRTDAELADKVHEIDKVVAGDYVRKSDLDKITDALFRKLDQISDKLDRKADRAL